MQGSRCEAGGGWPQGSQSEKVRILRISLAALCEKVFAIQARTERQSTGTATSSTGSPQVLRFRPQGEEDGSAVSDPGRLPRRSPTPRSRVGRGGLHRPRFPDAHERRRKRGGGA